MTTAERIHLLRRHGLENAVVAAVLGVDAAEIAAHVLDPSHEVTVGGGGSGDVTGLLPLDGSRAMTGTLNANAGIGVTGGDIEIVGADLGVTSAEDYSGSYVAIHNDGSIEMTGPLDFKSPEQPFDPSGGYGARLHWDDDKYTLQVEGYGVRIPGQGHTDPNGGLFLDGFTYYVGADHAVDPTWISTVAGDEFWGHFNILADGTMRWGVGHDNPDHPEYGGDGFGGFDVAISRYDHGPGNTGLQLHDPRPGGGEGVGLQIGDPSGVYFGVYATAYTEGYAAAADNWVHTVQVVGDVGTRGVWRADGQLQWGDGTAAPDVTLSRSADIDGPGLSLDGSLFLGLNSTYTVAGMELGPSGIYGQDDDGAISFSLFAGGLNFNGGAVNITRDSTYGLGLKIPGDSVARIFLDPHGPIGWSEGSSVDTYLQRRAAGLLEIPQSGGGYVAHSPDGTAYKLTPPNGGGAATWVAA